MESKRRLNNISIYRIIATICVLQFHVFYILYARAIPYEMLLSKGVQGLTAISGFLYSQKFISEPKKFYKNNLIKLIIPAVICILFMLVWDFGFMIANNNFDYMVFFTNRAFGDRLISQADNYYYLAYILGCYLITPLLQRKDFWKYFTIGVVFTAELSVGFFFGNAIIASTYIIGYLIGEKAFKTYTDTDTKYSFGSLATWIVILLASVGLYILANEVKFGDIYVITRLQDVLKNITSMSVGVSSFFLFALIFRFTNKYRGSKLLIYTDKLSFIIYLLNQAFMCGGMNVTLWVEPMWVKTILIYIFTIASSILLEFITSLINKKIINRPKAQIS